MLLLLTLAPPAHAIDGAFDCTSWTTPADAWAQVDALDLDSSVYGYQPETGVLTDPFEVALDTIYDLIEPGCPYYNDGGDLLLPGYNNSISQTCTTSDGTQVSWSRSAEGSSPNDPALGSWDITITPASGDLTEITLVQSVSGTAVSGHDADWYDIDTRTVEVTWAGHLADGWPDDGWFTLTNGNEHDEDYLDGSWSDSVWFDWASPTCGWSLAFAQSYDGPYLTDWTLTQGSQTLTVSGSEADTCGVEYVEATLDGVTGNAAADGWTSLTDADGDGYCAEVDDCRDLNSRIRPDAADRPYDGIDQDCSGADLTDVDGDGQSATRVGGTDCDDRNPAIRVGAADRRVDGIDQNCNGVDGS